MISPLTPRHAAELLLAASLRTGGMTQEEWLATLGGPGSGNFGHAGRPGEVGGSGSGDSGDGNGSMKLPKAGDVVDGREVLDEVPNQSSIGASLDEYEILNGIREVFMEDMDQEYINDVKSHKLSKRTADLADSIKESGKISPLIVVIADGEVPYILEGGHRYDALIKLGAKSFPAMVVRDTSYSPKALGGPGSGNFGHSGRPGEVGGSGDGGGESGDDRSDALKAWFGDSKVVDSSGKPLVVYHRGSFDEGDEVQLSVGAEGMHFGTKDAADSRPAGKVVDDLIKSITVDQDEETGKWFWSMDGVDSYEIDEEGFDSEADARESAEREAVTMGDNSEWEEDDIPLTAAYLKIVNPMRTSDQGADWSKAVALAKSKGHDGIVYRNQFEDKGRDSYIVFSPSQVKSVNSKRFDPNSDLITAGGKGSGNFGHAGRKGEVGGSAPGEGGGEPIEESVIHHAVGSWQESTEVVREFREMSIGETEESEEFKTFKKVMAALPREKRDTYRGFQALDLSQFEEGAEIDLNAFASSSRDYKGAEFYARREMDDLEKEVLFNNEPTSPVIMVFKGGAQFKARLPDVADAGFMKEVVIAPSKWVIKTAHDVFPSGKQLREVILVPR